MRAAVFAVDETFVRPFLVALRSIALHCAALPDVRVFVLHDGAVSDDSVRRIRSSGSALGLDLRLVNAVERLPEDLPLSPTDHVSKATFFRLFAGSLLPGDVSSALYLDSDLLVRRDVSDLFTLPLTSPIAAADHLSPPDEIRLWGPKGGGYFQAGVLLMDLEAWRREGREKQFLDVLRNQRGRIRWWDQDVLNIAFATEWQRLDIWNNVGFRAVAAIPVPTLRESARIVHFDGADKPWVVDKPRVFREEWYAAYEQTFGTAFDVRALRRPFWRRAASAVRRRVRNTMTGLCAPRGLKHG